ncbi:MAG: FtsX-like permease family protein [Coriobacteriia bacterium]|nr:FtsX-like permease family protein [Coriobacteriia bacterium]MCL2749944.1 FtsX-like permease family protein [Coriobacteriia bacterium]
MYIFQNAMQNLLRNKGRNLMTAAIIFVVIVSSVVALMIYNTSNGVINDYKSRFGSEVSLTPNMEKIIEATQTTGALVRPTIPAEQLIAFADSEHLLSANLAASGKGWSDDLKAIDGEKGGGGGPMLSAGPGGGPANMPDGMPELRQYFFRLLANQYDDFENGNRELTEGSAFPEKPGECLISQELLENSGLKIGDTIVMNSDLINPGSGPGDESYHDIVFRLTIVGTYLDLTDEYANSMMENAFSNRRNEVFMYFNDLASEVKEGLMGIDVGATYYLKSPELLSAFTAELRAKGLEDVFDVTTNEASYQAIVGPVEAMRGISLTFVIIVLIFGAIIIALLSSLAVRERKYEIGVLRAMGMKKGKVALGLWAETLTITALCLVLGLAVGGLAAQPVTNLLLNQQVEAAEQAQAAATPDPPGAVTVQGGGPQGVGGPIMIGGPIAGFIGQSSAEKITNIDVGIGLNTVVQIIVIALLLTSIAGLIATRQITKYEPMKILMERN